jgi:hypothetical protein
MAVMVALMPLVEMRPWNKVLYPLLVVCLFLIENHAITKDHADEAFRRRQENAQFKEIADGLSASIKEAQTGFDATMSQFSATIEKLVLFPERRRK